MRSRYKKIGSFVKQVNVRNRDLSVTNLQGININKFFMPSVANTNGTDLSKYKVVSQKQFAFNPMHVGRDEVLPISMLEEQESVIVSPAYIVFKVKDESQLLPEYLMMWCRRPEFDRNAWFTTDSSVRGGFSWKDFCDLTFPVPSIEKQREIVREYHAIVDRIKLNEQLNQKLEETAQAIYKRNWRKRPRLFIKNGLSILNFPSPKSMPPRWASRNWRASPINPAEGNWSGMMSWNRKFRRGGSTYHIQN